jgi:two-component system CheB/CheR fusion protein
VVTEDDWRQDSCGQGGIRRGDRHQGGRGLNILVVDDEPDTAKITASLLRLEGHRLRTARDGPSAFNEVATDPPDVVLLDIALPGMNGWQVAKQMLEQAAPKKPFVIAITGYGRPADRCRSEEAGIYLHLVKPVDPGYLLSLLKRFSSDNFDGPDA